MHSDVTHAIRDTIPVIFLTYSAITITTFLPSVRPRQRTWTNALSKSISQHLWEKLHQIFHQVRVDLLPTSLFWHILGIPQHYSASNLISRLLPTVTQVFMPNLHHAQRAPVTIPSSSMWPTGPLVNYYLMYHARNHPFWTTKQFTDRQ